MWTQRIHLQRNQVSRFNQQASSATSTTRLNFQCFLILSGSGYFRDTNRFRSTQNKDHIQKLVISSNIDHLCKSILQNDPFGASVIAEIKVIEIESG